MSPRREVLSELLVKRGKRYTKLCATQNLNSATRNGSHCGYTGPYWEVLPRYSVDFFDKPTMQVGIATAFDLDVANYV
jgi:hypothetical protein